MEVNQLEWVVVVKSLLLFFLFLLFSFASLAQTDTASSTPKEDKTIEVPVGIDTIEKIAFDYNTRVIVGNEQLLKLVLVPQKREIIFKGLKPGNTNVTIRDNLGEVRLVYTVNVTGTGTSKTISDLRELIGDIEGIDINIKGGKVFVEGEIVVPSDIGRLDKILVNFPEVITLIELSPQTQRVIARKMQDELGKNNLKDVSVRIVNGTFWLEGVVSSEGKKDLAMQIAEAYLPPKITSNAAAGSNRFSAPVKSSILSFIGVNPQKDPTPPAKMVKITSQFVELSKSYNRVFAFKWAPLMAPDQSSIQIGQTANGTVTTRANNTLSATISNLFPKLNSARTAGYARILQSAMIVAKDGEKNSKVQKKTTIPFAVGSGDFLKASTAEIGIIMTIANSIKEQEIVELGVNLSISTILGAGTPVTTQNSVETVVAVKSKDSAAIGGIVQNTANTDYDNEPSTPPAAGTTPPTPLFRLYRSKSYVTNKNQYVIFITPEIVENASTGTEEIRRKFRRRE